MNPDKYQNFKTRINSADPLIVPGCYDVTSALLVEAAEFESVLVSGYGVSASLLGMPDTEIYTASEIVDVSRKVCRRVQIPVMADADNGYGNAMNVMRTVADFEQSGVVSITLEDQVSPKKCPLLQNHSNLVSVEEAVGKLRAAIATRQNPDLVIVARTDARSEDEIIFRSKAYAAAGVDAIKLISPGIHSLEFLARVRAACGLPLMIASLGWCAGRETKEFNGLVGVITHPLMTLATAAAAVKSNLLALREGVQREYLPSPTMTQHDLEQVLGMEQIRKHEAVYLS